MEYKILLSIIMIGFHFLLSISISVSAYSKFDVGNDNCRRPVTTSSVDNQSSCYEIGHHSCFGTKLPYTRSTSELVEFNWTQQRLQNELSVWERFRNVPKCWIVLQPLLCAVYMPKCHDGVIELPSQELCKVTRSPCRLVEEIMEGWPQFLKCDDLERYPSNCKNTDIREAKLNMSTGCVVGMIPVEDLLSSYDGFDGCGLPCMNPFFTYQDHKNIQKIILYASISLLGAMLFVILTYWSHWKSTKGRPRIIFAVVLSFGFANFGWLIQFMQNSKEDIVCRKDGTLRRSGQPGDDNVFCNLVFAWINFFTFGGLGWLAIFSYGWNLTCNAVGTISKRIRNKCCERNIVVCLCSVFFTSLPIAFTKVEGDSIAGICFIGTSDMSRLFLLIPLVAYSMIIIGFFVNGCLRLYHLQNIGNIIPQTGRKHLRQTLMQTLFFTIGISLLLSLYIGIEIYEMAQQRYWNSSLRQSLICRVRHGDNAPCLLQNGPSSTLIIIKTLLFFIGGILMTSWTWTKTSITNLKASFDKLWKRCRGQRSRETGPYKIQRHRLIAQAYQKRHDLENGGRISLSLQSVHPDPIGMNRLLDPNELFNNSNPQLELDEVSSEWALALPRLLRRRDAVVIIPNSTNDNSRSSSAMSQNQTSPVKRSRLRLFKEKLGGKGKGSTGSIESSDTDKQFQSSNSEIEQMRDKQARLKVLKDKLGRRDRFGWMNRRGSTSSLRSNSSNVLGKIDPRLLGRRKVEEMGRGAPSGSSSSRQGPTTTVLRVRETSVQTSLENLSQSKYQGVSKFDKGLQTSIECLNRIDFGTQTKKSSTKKHKKHLQQYDQQLITRDPVLKLLTPT